MSENGVTSNNRFKLKKIIFLTLVIAFVVFVVVYGIDWYQNYSASQESRFNYEKYKVAEKEFIAALTADTYGGKTPEETLQLFISALKAGDIELASKYFALETNSQDPNYLTRKNGEEFLFDLRNRGFLDRFIRDIEKEAKLSGSVYEGNSQFKLYNNDGTVGLTINLKFNTYSQVWKIESL